MSHHMHKEKVWAIISIQPWVLPLNKSGYGQFVDIVFFPAPTVQPRNNSIEETQRQRKQLLNDYCEKHNKRGASNKGDYYHLLVNEKHKMIYCYTPKVGCTQWFKIMGTLEGLPDHIVNPDPKLGRDSRAHDRIHSRGLFRFLGSYPVEQAHKMLEEYTTFMFVREPFERTLSAYRDKFTQTYWPGYYYHRIASSIMRQVRPGATEEDLKSGLGLTFEEFTRYIAGKGASSWDHHWGLYDDICRPCKIKYDFIGHFENMDEEGPYILKKVGVDHLVSGNFKPSKTSSRLIEFYSQIPKRRIEKILDLMRSNFEMFGYQYPGPLEDLL